MFGLLGLGKATCILCDRRVPRKQTLSLRDHKGYAVCWQCLEQWKSRGGTCARCQSPLRGAQQAGLFMDGRRSFGHADCGAASLVAA